MEIEKGLSVPDGSPTSGIRQQETHHCWQLFNPDSISCSKFCLLVAETESGETGRRLGNLH
jgi:hypothetical protein